MAGDLTPRWAMDAYNRILDARRHMTEDELREMEEQTKRDYQRARIMRRLERVA